MKLFVATAGLAIATANECGSCWEAGDDGNCVPQAGKVTTTCGSNTINVEIDPCLLEGTHPYNMAYVGDQVSSEDAPTNCLLSNSDGTLKISHGLEDCGTTMEYDSATNQVHFTVSSFTNLNLRNVNPVMSHKLML